MLTKINFQVVDFEQPEPLSPWSDHSGLTSLEQAKTLDRSQATEPGEPSTFIRIVHHPHSGIDQDKIIPLVESALGLSPGTGIDNSAFLKWTGDAVPWLPFRTHQDFKYTLTAVRGIIPRKIIDEQLHGQHNGWSDSSKITLRNSVDMLQTLAAA